MVETYNTFQLEHCIVEKIFERSWDKMTPEQRTEFLKTIDHKGNISNKAGIAALSGAGALAALGTTAYLTGTAFFTTTMSAIAFLGHTVGVALPFMVYTNTATALGVLTGPVGWGLAAVVGAGGLALCGQANADKTAQVIIQIHAIKLDAMSKSGVNIDQYLPLAGKQ